MQLCQVYKVEWDEACNLCKSTDNLCKSTDSLCKSTDNLCNNTETCVSAVKGSGCVSVVPMLVPSLCIV